MTIKGDYYKYKYRNFVIILKLLPRLYSSFFPLLIRGLRWPSHLTYNFKLLQYKLHKFWDYIWPLNIFRYVQMNDPNDCEL